MLASMIRAGHDLLMQPQCPICRATITSDAESSKPCPNCCMKLDLPADGLIGLSPLNWRGSGLVRRSSPPTVVESASRSDALIDTRLSKAADPARTHQRCTGTDPELEKPKTSKSFTPASGQWPMPSLPWPLTPPPCNRGTTPSRQTATPTKSN